MAAPQILILELEFGVLSGISIHWAMAAPQIKTKLPSR